MNILSSEKEIKESNKLFHKAVRYKKIQTSTLSIKKSSNQNVSICKHLFVIIKPPVTLLQLRQHIYTHTSG